MPAGVARVDRPGAQCQPPFFFFLQDKLLKLFAKHEFYTLEDLSQLTRQPKVRVCLWPLCDHGQPMASPWQALTRLAFAQTHVKEILTGLADYHSSGPDHGRCVWNWGRGGGKRKARGDDGWFSASARAHTLDP